MQFFVQARFARQPSSAKHAAVSFEQCRTAHVKLLAETKDATKNARIASMIAN
jgi:hypothetical protein